MRRIQALLMLTSALLWAGCSSTTVHRESAPIVGLRNPSVHFVVDNTQKLPVAGTFDWGFAVFRVANLPELDLSVVDQRIHGSLEKTLSAKGFTKTNASPDFLVSYALANNAAIDEKTLNGAYDGMVQSPPYVSGNDQKPLQYRRGSLIIDIVDAKTKHLLWRGAIMAEIDMGLTEEQKQRRCNDVIAELLKHYPKP